MSTKQPPPEYRETATTLIIEPATEGRSNDVYWQAIDDDPSMVVVVEVIEDADAPTSELVSRVRAGEIMSNTFVFSRKSLAIEFGDSNTASGRSCLLFARRIDEPDFGEKPAGELC